jgi:hypothetical protein
LIEAAASGAQPQGDLRAHLAGCADCRAAFAQEQSLFASIDAGLHVAANAEAPASLLPRVRARLDEAVAKQRRWLQPVILAAASVALTFAIFLFARPHPSRPDNQAKQTPQILGSETVVKNARPQVSGPATQIVSSTANKSQTRVHSTLLRPVASSQLEVLVPPDEREAFARFVAVLGERREVALALATPAPQTKDEPAGLEPLQINGLEIKLLAGTESEQSDGAEQKQ